MTDLNMHHMKDVLKKQVDINKRLNEDIAALHQVIQEIIKVNPELAKHLDKYIEFRDRTMLNQDSSTVASEIKKQEESLSRITNPD